MGEYSTNTTIDVSALGATSADQFLLVPKNGSISGTQSIYNTKTIGWQTESASLNIGSLSLNNGILSVTVPTMSSSYRGYYNDGTLNLSGDASGKLTCKIYYVGDIESV